MNALDVNGINDSNIESLNNIIWSIDTYLLEIERSSRFRAERNHAGAMKDWQRKFIICKEKLHNAQTEISACMNWALLTSQANEGSFQELKALLKELPVFKQSAGAAGKFYMQFSQSVQPMIDAQKAWEMTRKQRFEIIDKFHKEITRLYKEYNYWVAEAEIIMRLNFRSMNPIERAIRELFQVSALAENLRESVVKNRMQTIYLSPIVQTGFQSLK